jgi:hypothetical protein
MFSAIIAAFWGIYVYNKQQRFKRLQNLSQLFQRFADKNDFLEIFSLCDESYIDRNSHNEVSLELLKNTSVKTKLQYLALLEEVALYASYSEVDRKYAVHLFQWHFYYIYKDLRISESFWHNLGGIKEKDKPYWQYQKHFSKTDRSF